MLQVRSFRALAAAAVLSLTWSACVVRWSDEPVQDDDSSFFGDDDSSTVSTGDGGDNSTGVGGDNSTGVGGDATTGAGGLGGGDPYCVDGEGEGQTAQMCEDLAISATNFGTCEDGFTSLGYASCTRSFEIWEAGFAEELATCLSYIPAEDACSEEPVLDCVDNLYMDTCEVPYIEDSCQAWADTCAASGESLDAAQCYSDLTPFNDDGIVQLSDCMNATEGDCQERYDVCFEEVTALD